MRLRERVDDVPEHLRAFRPEVWPGADELEAFDQYHRARVDYARARKQAGDWRGFSLIDVLREDQAIRHLIQQRHTAQHNRRHEP